MKYSLEVCLVALTLAANVTQAVAQSPIGNPELKVIRRSEAAPTAVQAMQKGISVQLPVTSNATPMPDADKEGSLIVSVTDDGSMYLGIAPVDSATLSEEITGSLSNQMEKTLYIKADARTPYANVLKALDAASMAGVGGLDLLTAQADSSDAGTLVPPKGLDVLVGSSRRSGSESIVVQVLNTGERSPTLVINHESIPWTALQSTLSRLLQNRPEKMVQVTAERTVLFADVVTVIDRCRSTGAKVVLITRER